MTKIIKSKENSWNNTKNIPNTNYIKNITLRPWLRTSNVVGEVGGDLGKPGSSSPDPESSPRLLLRAAFNSHCRRQIQQGSTKAYTKPKLTYLHVHVDYCS